MISSETPLDIAELLHHILTFVHADSPDPSNPSCQDFCAYALVSRSWVYPSQTFLYSTIRVDHTCKGVLRLLLRTLERSPHLAGCLRELHIMQPEPELAKRLGDIPLPRLISLDVFAFYKRHDPAEVAAGVIGIQNLLRNPSLLSVNMFYQCLKAEDSLRIWVGCSETIRDLSGICAGAPPSLVGAGRAGGIKLDSLAVSNETPQYTQLWLEHPRLPFDFSALKAFQLDGPIDTCLSDMLGATMRTVEIFSMNYAMNDFQGDGNIPDFAQMNQIDLTIRFPFNADFRFLRTIRPNNRARLRAIGLDLVDSQSVAASTQAHALVTQLSTIPNDFPNVRIVAIYIPLPHHRRESVEVEWKKCLESVDLKFTLRWIFGERQVPWHTKIV
ncbi:hypothetical protein FB45DRAFT_243550 [Roridomyces roridus]|uniref:Uncharacterized protein n=1 Tax=Roridomyces roridus TaxID=1738132 RepID=A0AAD7FEE3_9AGAR|nr:hypothetical protein FB45DRAFT_243550 [Roridomyces roridus]